MRLQQDKLAFLTQQQSLRVFSSSQWEQIVANFRPTAELRQRVAPLLNEYHQTGEANDASHERVQWYGRLASKPMKYGVTVMAMMLAVVALGNLLLHRPQGRGRWSEIYVADQDSPSVVRIVILLALLGGFDLLLTLAAQQAGTLLELNPLGSELVSNPLLLASFKMTSLLIACLILVSLRRYRVR